MAGAKEAVETRAFWVLSPGASSHLAHPSTCWQLSPEPSQALELPAVMDSYQELDPRACGGLVGTHCREVAETSWY